MCAVTQSNQHKYSLNYNTCTSPLVSSVNTAVAIRCTHSRKCSVFVSYAFEKENCWISLNRRPKERKDYLKFSQLNVDVLLVCTDDSGIIAGFKQEATTCSRPSLLSAVNLMLSTDVSAVSSPLLCLVLHSSLLCPHWCPNLSASHLPDRFNPLSFGLRPWPWPCWKCYARQQPQEASTSLPALTKGQGCDIYISNEIYWVILLHLNGTVWT